MIAADIVKALGGNWNKRNGYGFVSCPCHADKTPSLKIKDAHDGDVILYCFAGCDWKQIKDVLRQKGLLSPLNELKEHKARSKAAPITIAPVAAEVITDDVGADVVVNSRIEAARQIWRSTVPAPDTPVETYLRGRSITAPIPPSIRYAPDLRHAPTGLTLPTMVAAVQGPDRQITGIH